MNSLLCWEPQFFYSDTICTGMHNDEVVSMSVRSGSTRLYAILIMVLIIAGGSIAAIVLLQTTPSGDDVDLVTLTGSDATTHVLTMNELLAMTPVNRSGGYENSYENIRGVGVYVGAKMSDILALVGGMTEDNILIVNASDGYEQTFAYDNVYPNADEYAIQGDMVLAYSYNGTVIPEYEDGPRLMFLPEDGLYTNSDANLTIDAAYSAGAAGPKLVSNVAEIIITARPEPESDLLTVKRDASVLGYTLSEIMGMPSLTGTGGYIKTTGTIVGPYNYTGVPIEYLLSQTGSLPVEYTIEVKSDDGYVTYYNNTQVEGSFLAYDHNGDVVGIEECTMMLAYYEGGEPLPSGGPLRIVTVNEDGYLTDGHWWAKYVVNITLIDTVVPWQLQLDGVQSWNMTYDTFYALASCAHHRTGISYDSILYEGVPLWTVVASMDGGDDDHYTFNTSLAVSGYNVTLFDSHGGMVNFTSAQLAGNSSIILAGWADGILLDDTDWPLKLVTLGGYMLGNIVRIEMWGWD
jgi:DMSO/TMAO reductase YedYZ molybdopterin-dependent catalytic subunit